MEWLRNILERSASGQVLEAGWIGFPFVPKQASSVAGEVDALFFVLVGISGFFSLLIALLIIYFSIKYRKGSKADRTEDLSPRGDRRRLWLEIGWTIVPLLISLVLYVWAANLYFRVKVPPRDAIDISVTAKQWMWKFQHPEGQREIDALHVPTGQAVRLTMTSQDVIHSLFIPAFRIKQDVLPDRYTTAWFMAIQPGEYHLFCTQYCGTSHANMVGKVIVMDPSDYQHWLNDTTANKTMASSGEQLFQQMGCAACHETNGIRAPLLKGLYGRTVKLQDGRTVVAERSYIRDSILLPSKDIVAGYPNIMPTFTGALSDEQVMLLVEYIKSLGNAQAPAAPTSGQNPAEVKK